MYFMENNTGKRNMQVYVFCFHMRKKIITFAWYMIADECFQMRIHLNTNFNDGGKHQYNSFQILMDVPPLGHAIFLCLLLYINTVNNPDLSFIFCRREISRPCLHRGTADSLAGFNQSTSLWKSFLQWYKRMALSPGSSWFPQSFSHLSFYTWHRRIKYT